MKRFTAALSAIAFLLSLGATAQAGCNKAGHRGNCGDCASSTTLTEQQQAFQQNTIDLRQEMMLKRFEIQRENLKATPDSVKIATLQTEIKTIQNKIHDIRLKSGLPESGLMDGECCKGMKDCNGDKVRPGGCNGPCNRK